MDYVQMPRTIINVDAQAVTGLFEASWHPIGLGAVNSLPLVTLAETQQKMSEIIIPIPPPRAATRSFLHEWEQAIHRLPTGTNFGMGGTLIVFLPNGAFPLGGEKSRV